MRKMTLALLAVVCVWAATSWQSQPRWRTVQSIVLTHQTQPIPQTTIFTPTERGLYRLNTYMTAGGRNIQASWQMNFDWNDIDGSPFSYGISSYDSPSELVYIFSPQPNTPVSYMVTQVPGYSGGYDLVITIEQLQ
jgi:hypothetical protein